MSPNPFNVPRGSIAPGGQPIKRLDLTGRDRQMSAGIAAMDRVGATFARFARRSLPFLARYRTRITPSPVRLVGPDGDPSLTPLSPSFTVMMTSADGFTWASITMDANAIAITIEGALGGGAIQEATGVGPDLSPAQRALISRIAKSLATDLANALKEETKLIVAPSVHTGPEQGMTPSKPGDSMHLICEMEGLPFPASLILAVSAEPIEAAARDQGAEEPTHGDPRMGEALQEVPVEVAAELGRVSLGLHQVLGLRVGDVLRLSTAVDDTINLRIAGVIKFTGTPTTSRGQISVEIKERHGE
jgi:flagellar motor switch protein FliM